ncbi:hypothetical protein DO021_22305 [Desulfobacter hydrogenophilus]|uniref:Uncharacterized protein n=1 Tax=Desulfobacter hydrogenophilus TaxID=2291 RepID=A0A328F8W4_9BACT|nr:hypothetical protein [Desulfobacter hydrogenophilus]NDY74643.1 hypothetical protein [Desulfobacter hydrogenophilus]QBH14677.1 hypothetical protein EYB58_18170 [Desulfobacter hydrogenophilus]RAL99841.1 hypothetical protein DO021_22305 [Desulfobacter hydrogenophilus]
MSITGGMLQSVLTSYSSYSTQSSSKHSSTGIANISSSPTGDTVSLSTQSLSADIKTDSDSTTVELSAQSVSVTESSELGGYDLSNITPDDLDYMSAELYNNGIISKEQFLTLGSIAFYHKYANGHAVNPDNSPFDLLLDLKEIASGNCDSMSTCTWNRDKDAQSEIAASLLNILTNFENDTNAKVEVDYSLVNISITA